MWKKQKTKEKKTKTKKSEKLFNGGIVTFILVRIFHTNISMQLITIDGEADLRIHNISILPSDRCATDDQLVHF